MASTPPKAGNLPITLATYIFLLDEAGHRPNEATIQLACNALRNGRPEQAEELGAALVAKVAEGLGGGDLSFDQVLAYVQKLYGADHIGSDLGKTREERTREARRYEFQVGHPWLAKVVDRFPDGTVGAHWVLVERVADTVRCMDPYPWDDLDEEYEAPVADFMVKWELAGSHAIRWVA